MKRSVSICVHCAPAGVAADRLGIPHSRVVHEERNAALRGHLPPEPERVADESEDAVAGLGRIARQTGMSFAVALEVIRMNLIDDVLDHRTRCVLADRRTVFPGMKIEVDAEEALARRSRGGIEHEKPSVDLD